MSTDNQTAILESATHINQSLEL